MPGKTREDSQRTRDTILDAAEQVILCRGMGRTTMADIAHAANVSRGAVYGHYKNKIDLSVAMCERAFASMEIPVRTEGESALQTLYREGIHLLHLYLEPGPVQRVLQVLYIKCDESEDHLALLDIRNKWEAQCMADTEKLITEAVANTQLPPTTDIKLANLYLHSLLDGIYSTLFYTNRVSEYHWEIAEKLYRAGFSGLKTTTELSLETI